MSTKLSIKTDQLNKQIGALDKMKTMKGKRKSTQARARKYASVKK